MSLGQKIKKLRTEKNMTQSKLAELLFVTRQAITNYERDANMPSIDILKKMAEIFEVDLNYLLDEPKEENKKKSKGKIIGLVSLCSIVFIFIVVTLGIVINNAQYQIIGYYITFDENKEYSIDELLKSDLPYEFNLYDEHGKPTNYRNSNYSYEILYFSTKYDRSYVYYIYNKIGTNKYRIVLKEQLRIDSNPSISTNNSINIYSKYFNQVINISFIAQIKDVRIISFDEYNNVLLEEVITINENNEIYSNVKGKMEEFEYYKVMNATRYYVKVTDVFDRSEQYNILESKDITIFLTNGDYNVYNDFVVRFIF